MRRALPGVERALFWTLVFAAFAAVAVALGARAADRIAVSYEQQRTNYAIVRVIAPEGEEAITAAQTALNTAPHVTSAAPMTAGRAAALLQQWGGSDVAAEDLPPLRLFEIELAPAEAQVDVNGDIVAALAQGGVTAEVVGAPDTGSGGGLAGIVRQIALWGAAAFAVLMAVIVWLAARGLAARRREMVTVMCDLGATQGETAGRIADEAAMTGLVAGVVGGVLAGITALVVLMLAIPGVQLETLRDMILPIDLLPIAAAPIGVAIAAGAGARAAAATIHRQAARLG
ncbi:FtsX-like permease family protein [Vitreimonas flagellata]|uniref:FtsX-like permease family protein n=1 Tax=Vitreimonas flagellata TaxID=2560861 RepID=UPI001075216E|nr:FtsX-like permease family protein [Vitreimonas flagellata]